MKIIKKTKDYIYLELNGYEQDYSDLIRIARSELCRGYNTRDAFNDGNYEELDYPLSEWTTHNEYDECVFDLPENIDELIENDPTLIW